MKKNKGFSLVELIIVIAIMAILAAAIAPALIRYIDKSRKADDVTAAGTIATAANAALANEAAYDAVSAHMNGNDLICSAGATGTTTGFTASSNDDNGKFTKELNANLTGNVAPKIKFKKDLSETTVTPEVWYVYLSKDTPQVFIGTTGNGNKVMLAPSIYSEYQ
jgi:type IV pilus assembly protein PilA